MKNWISKNYKTLIISAFLIPIITVALVSISHVTKWYGISNPLSWAVYLSIGIEIAALSALAAISADMGRKVYFPFGIVTLIQFIGNIYFAYSYIDVTSQAFISWVELVSPLIEFIGVDPTDMIGHKRFLAFFAGGMLPIISLSFLHMLVKFTQSEKNNVEVEQSVVEKAPEPVGEEIPVVDAKDVVGEVSRVRFSQEDLDILEKILNRTQPKNVEDTQEEEDDDSSDVFLIEDHLIKDEPVVVQEPTVPDEPIIETPEPIIEEQPIIVEEPIIEEEPEVVEEATITPEPIIEEQAIVVEEPTVPDEPIVEEQAIVVEEPIVEEQAIIVEEPTVPDEPIVEEQPVIIEEQLPIEEEKKN